MYASSSCSFFFRNGMFRKYNQNQMINNADDNNIERIKFVAVYIKYEFVLNEIRSADIRIFLQVFNQMTTQFYLINNN